MNIVVVGDGKVGYTLTASLSKEGHDVTVIDNRPDTLRNTTNELDVICIEGNGVSYAVQSEAGVQKADLLIAATSADEINMLACMVAKKLGAKHTIARVRDPQYQQQMFFLRKSWGSVVVIEQSAASEISALCALYPLLRLSPLQRAG
ncbi:MAG: NAD-binding protein [Christensenellales bacterium]